MNALGAELASQAARGADWYVTVEPDGLILIHGSTEGMSPRRKEVADWIVETINDAGDRLHKRGKYAEAA
jgi:hypothetical protein